MLYKLAPFVFIFTIACDYAVYTQLNPPCNIGDTVTLFVKVDNWVNADSTNYFWNNGFQVELITCDSLNDLQFCETAVFVDHLYFWSGEVKEMQFVNGGGFDAGLVWLPPSPIQDSIPYPVTITAYEDPELTIVKFGPYIAYPLYYQTDYPNSAVTGFNQSAKTTPNLCQ